MNDHSRFVMAARFRPVPRPGHFAHRIATGILLGLAALGWGSPSLDAQMIVAPNNLAETDGNTSATTPSTDASTRVMYIYDASQFQALTKPAYLTGFALRPDQTPGPSGPRTVTLKIFVSTTSRSLTELSAQFNENIGADNTLVLDGILVLSTANQAGPGNTRQFDYTWPFTTPFLYDPRAGNLVIDVQIAQGTGPSIRHDSVDGSPVAKDLFASGSPTATSGQFGAAPVAQFIFEPALVATVRTSQVEVCWESLPNATYRVEWRTDVSQAAWTPLVECVRSTGATTCVQDAVAPGAPRRFYRVVRADCSP